MACAIRAHLVASVGRFHPRTKLHLAKFSGVGPPRSGLRRERGQWGGPTHARSRSAAGANRDDKLAVVGLVLRLETAGRNTAGRLLWTDFWEKSV